MNSKQRWYAKLKADPERYKEYLRQWRERRRREADPEGWAERQRKQQEIDNRRIAKLKADPERWAERLRRRRETARIYRETRREELAKKERERQAANPEAISKAKKERRAANLEKYRENGRKDYAANSGEYKRRAWKRKLSEINALGYHTEKEFQDLCSYYMDQCLACGDVPDKLSRDHVIPLVKGGSDDISNIQPLCRGCNASKGTKTIGYRV